MGTKSNRECLIEEIEQEISELRADKVRDDVAVEAKIATLESVIAKINAQPKRNGKKKAKKDGEGK